MSSLLSTTLAIALTLSVSTASPFDFFRGGSPKVNAPNDIAVHRRQTSCASGIHLMVAGGTDNTSMPDVNGFLQNLVNNITYDYPGTDEHLQPYHGYATEARTDTPEFVQNATNYVAQCPETPIVLIGYSLGGIIIMNSLCGGLNPNISSHFIAAIVYGEETWTANQTWDYGTCTQNAPKYARADPSTCNAYGSILHSWCDATDPECCSGGTDYYSHYAYDTKYDSAALSFISQQYSSYTASRFPIPYPTQPVQTSVFTTSTTSSSSSSTLTTTTTSVPTMTTTTTSPTVTTTTTSPTVTITTTAPPTTTAAASTGATTVGATKKKAKKDGHRHHKAS